MKINCSDLKIASVLMVISCLLSGCAIPQAAILETDLKSAYQRAVKDAEHAEPREISKNLVAVVPSNDNLLWSHEGQPERVLVVTWTNYDGYDDKIGQSVSLSREVWVTTVPEVRNFCKGLAENKTLRLEQLLGLPPNAQKTKFVEMWVEPGNLFRPSADPEITDSEAEIEFRMSNKFLKLSNDYITWFDNLKAKSYGSNGYPWTRLGYTYDWGSDSHTGASEFVIFKDAVVKINSVSPTEQYCQ